MMVEDGLDLQRILLEAVKTYPAKRGEQDAFGQRYTLDFRLEWQNKSAIVRSSWIIKGRSIIE